MTAIVTDVHYRMSLALIRDLVQAGVRVICCERRGVSAPLGFASRYTDRTALLPETGWLDALYDLCAAVTAEEGERPALLPVGAATLAELAREPARERFSGVCGLCVPTPEQLDLFNSKRRAAELARELGVPVPEAFVRRPGETPEAFAGRLPLPCVVKPLCGEKLGLTAADRYAVCAAPEEAAAAIRHFEDLAGEPPVVQAYLPGGALGCSVLAEEGRVIASICHRRVREYPVSGGPSACCDCVERPDLTAWAARMVERVGYTGLAMFEFKEDAAGEARLLEVNPRIWGTFPLTRASGSGMSLLWCLLAWNRGNPDRAAAVPPPAKPRPCRMRFVPSDLMSGLGYLRRGELRRGLAAAGDLFRPTVRDGLWEWSDPGPGLMYYKSLFRKDKP